MGDFLDRLNHLSKMHSDTLRGGRRIIQFMRQAGGHCAECLQLFLLSGTTLDVPKTCHHRAENFRSDFRTEPQQSPKCFLRKNDQSRVALGARGEHIRRAEQQRDFAEKRTGSVASDNAVFLQGADFSLKENKKMTRPLAFLEEHFAGGNPPFFRLFNANLLFLPKVGKKRNFAEQGHHGLALRQLFDSTQNPFTCWRQLRY